MLHYKVYTVVIINYLGPKNIDAATFIIYN